MKIWEGCLALECDSGNKFNTKFSFNQLGGDFTFKRNVWVSEKGYFYSSKMTVDTSFADLYITKVFDRELSKKEQELLEIEMKVCLKEYLRDENEKINKIYENRMKAINMKE